MMTDIKPIETVFNGCRYRSRMEARWAVFMDTMHIPFVYEPEAYMIDGQGYLPDFYLEDQDAFFEIKSPTAPSSAWRKLVGLVRLTGKTGFLMRRPPVAPPDFSVRYDEEAGAIMFCKMELSMPDGIQPGGEVGEDSPYLWCECPRCGRTELQFDGRADRIKCGCQKSPHGDKGYNAWSPRLLRAYNYASGYRFEPGAALR